MFHSHIILGLSSDLMYLKGYISIYIDIESYFSNSCFQFANWFRIDRYCSSLIANFDGKCLLNIMVPVIVQLEFRFRFEQQHKPK